MSTEYIWEKMVASHYIDHSAPADVVKEKVGQYA